MNFHFKVGMYVKIESVEYDEHSSAKLLNMGLTPGTVFKVISIAPLGDPIIIEIRNYNLAVRKKDLIKLSLSEIKEDTQ